MSRTYIAEIVELRVQEKVSRRSGGLRVHTRIDLRGNPIKGPIPVQVEHDAIFTFDDPFLVEPNHVPPGGGFFNTEDGRCEVTQIVRGFPTSQECHAWVVNHFVLTSEEQGRLTRRCI